MKVKTLLALILMLVMVFPLSACGKGGVDDSSTFENTMDKSEKGIAESDKNTSEEELKTTFESALNMKMCTYCSNYSEGFAWSICTSVPDEFGFPDGFGFYTAVIDYTGKMIFNWNSERLTYTTPESIGFLYEDGYSYVNANGEFSVIDNSGNLLYSCPDDSNNVILGYGGGVVITRNYYADFDSSGYTYTVYSPDGSIISQEKTDYVLDHLYYCGQGIFGFYMNEEENCHFYNSKSNSVSKTTLDIATFTDNSFNENDSILYIGYYYDWENEKEDEGIYRFLNKSGEIISVKITSEDSHSEAVMVSEDKCMIKTKIVTGENRLYIYNYTTNQLEEVNLPYEDKILWGAAFEFGEGKIVVPLKGEDDRTYVIVIDEDGKLLLEPTLANHYTRFSDDRMILTNDDDWYVYDESLNIVYSISQLEVVSQFKSDYPYSSQNYSLEEYSDGAAVLVLESKSLVYGEENRTTKQYWYLDKDGNLLFDNIDMSLTININSALSEKS